MKNEIDKLVTEALQSFAASIEAEAKKQLANAGIAHITPKTEVKKGLLGVDFSLSLPGYTIYVEHGVRGTENTPAGTDDSPFEYKHLHPSKEMINNLRQWASSKGITPKPRESKLKKTNTRKRLKEALPNPETQLAFAMAKSIKKRGLSPKKILEKTLTNERLQALADDISVRLKQEATVWLAKN